MAAKPKFSGYSVGGPGLACSLLPSAGSAAGTTPRSTASRLDRVSMAAGSKSVSLTKLGKKELKRVTANSNNEGKLDLTNNLH